MSRKSAPNPPVAALESAFQELETIVGEIEFGALTLEQGLERCRRGSDLIRHCRQVLLSAERQLTQLPGLSLSLGRSKAAGRTASRRETSSGRR